MAIIDELKAWHELPAGFDWAGGEEDSRYVDGEGGWVLVAVAPPHPAQDADLIEVWHRPDQGEFIAALYVNPGPESAVSIEFTPRSDQLDEVVKRAAEWTEEL